MRILAIGDFHGKVPVGLKRFVKRNKVDLVLSPGDFNGFWLRNVYWKYFYKLGRSKGGGVSSKGLKEIVGAKKYNESIKRDEKSGIKVLRYLDELDAPVFIIYGNEDEEEMFKRRRKKSRKFTVYKLKNVKFINLKYIKFDDYHFVGIADEGMLMLKRVKTKRGRRMIRKLKNRMRKIFKKIDPSKTILLAHRPPYNTKLDRHNDPSIPGYGKHYGDEALRYVIERYQPLLNVCGHMHENQGKIKIGKSLVVNSGFGRRGEFALIDLKGKRIKVNLYKSFKK